MKKRILVILSLTLALFLMSCSNSNNNEMQDGNAIETRDEILTQIEESTDWVADLSIAKETNQILTVVAEEDMAVVSLHNKDEKGIWKEVLSAEAEIGKNGIGKTKEGDGKTPTGVYHFMFGFGIKENPGTVYEYTVVDDSYYWVDDSDSKYYNQFVSVQEIEKDWDSAEHIISEKDSYHYVLALDYNKECVPEKGSAIFMHCKPTGGAGCIAVSEDVMIEMMQKIQKDCIVIIDDKENILTY